MSAIKILAVGDVVGDSGCKMLSRVLPDFKRRNEIDVVVVNGENSAEGNGITVDSCRRIFDAGADVVTTGNHVFRRREIYTELEENPFLLRPANYPDKARGKGVTVVDRGRWRLGVINLMGAVYMNDTLASPFECADALISRLKSDGVNTIAVDFHAEATGEKKALGFYLDGRAAAVWGTHTHVQTADDTILPKGTGYITDLGMTGPEVSVLGVEPSLAVARMTEKMPVKFQNAATPPFLCGCVFTVELGGKTVATQRVMLR